MDDGYGPAAVGSSIAFGPFRLLPARQLLLEGDEPVALGSRALDILVALVERTGEVVGKEELIARVWPDTFVEDSNLRVHVAALRKALRDGQDGNRFLATISGRGYRFVAPVSVAGAQAAATPRPASPGRPGLPPALTRVVGRDGTVAALAAQLPQRRLVTLTGPGGIGKTTVALAVAREVAASYPDGVAFVDLAPVGDPRLVPGAIAAALGLAAGSDDPTAAVVAFFRGKRLLLLLDNCEHLVEAVAPAAEDVVRGAPDVHVLATSREPLRAAGERVHRLAPLEAPSASAGLTAAEALTFPGVQLFVERAAESVDGFGLGDADAPLVADICRRLDGVPLAIELAAGRVDAFGVRGLAAHLDDRFRLLTTGRRTALPRHQTLAATLDWSHDLLPGAERALLRRLAVFAGDFSLEAAIALAPDQPPSEVVAHVADLVAKSLVVADHRGEAVRYRLLDTTRLYGLERLRESGELGATRRRHAEHFRDFFAPAEDECETRTKAEWLAAYGRHIDNVRAALDWAFSGAGDPAVGVALTAAAVPLWVQLSLMGECRARVERALASIVGDTDEAARARMRLSAALGWALTFAVGRAREAGEAWAAALALAERLGDRSCQLRALWGLWINHLNDGEFREALELARRFAGIAAGSPDPVDQMMSDRMLANSLHYLGDQTGARHHIERMFGRYGASTHQRSVVRFQSDQHVRARYFHARILWLQGLADRARRAVERNVAEAETLDHALTFGSVLGQGACPVALLCGDLEAAGRHADALLDHAERHGLGLWQGWARCFKALLGVKRGDRGVRDLRAELDRAGQARFLPRYLLLLGEYALCLGEAGEVGPGLETVDGAIERCERNEELWYVAELLRIKGELTVRAGDAALAEEHFLRALDWGERQGALSWRLRAATGLAGLWRDQGRAGAARELLAGVHGEFSEGFDTHDLRAAARLLDELA